MVGHRAISGHHFQGLDRSVFGESGRQDEHLILIGHVAAMHVCLIHGTHDIRRSNLTAVIEIGQPRIVCRIPLRLALRHPRAEDIQFIRCQHHFTHEVPVLRVGRPRGHVADGRHIFDELPVGRHFFISREWHGADATFPMAR